LLDRTLVRRAVTDTARETMRNLERRFREHRQPSDGAAGVARAGARRELR
jgi:hypothetical protein